MEPKIAGAAVSSKSNGIFLKVWNFTSLTEFARVGKLPRADKHFREFKTLLARQKSLCQNNKASQDTWDSLQNETKEFPRVEECPPGVTVTIFQGDRFS